MQRSMKTRTLKTVKAALSCFMSASLALYMPVMAYAQPYNLETGSITVNSDASGNRTVSQDNGVQDHPETSETVITSNNNVTNHTVTINSSGTGDNAAEVTLQNVNINTGSNGGAAVSTNGSGDVNIELNGSNTLQSGNQRAGLEKGSTGNLTIQDDNNADSAAGSLTATGGNSGAGIGGGYMGGGRTITIEGGTVTAIGGNTGAGIGGGYQRGVQYVSIEGGTVIAIGGNTGAGIGCGRSCVGSANITISGDAVVAVAGGAASERFGCGAPIGDSGKSNGDQGNSLAPNTDNLNDTGRMIIFEPGTTAAEIRAFLNSEPAAQGLSNSASSFANAPQTAENSTRADEATSTAPATDQDTDAAFNAAVDMQIDDLLRQLYSLLETGRLDEANALIAKGFVINAGTHKGFDRVTLEKLGELSRAGVAVTINFTYAGVNYSVTIPAKTEIDPASLGDENGYCGLLNLMKYFG